MDATGAAACEKTLGTIDRMAPTLVEFGYKSTHAARGDPPPSRPGAMPQGSAQHAGSLQGALRRRKSLVVSAHVDAGSNIRAYLAGALGSKCAALIRFLNCDLSELPSYSELTT